MRETVFKWRGADTVKQSLLYPNALDEVYSEGHVLVLFHSLFLSSCSVPQENGLCQFCLSGFQLDLPREKHQ